jgi:S-adenosylmethionine:tRNA ribosyltransferase-isomerase
MNLAASRPAEARGLTRDGVRLLVGTPDGIAHARFRELPRFLSAGDLLVVNTSATLAAAVEGQRSDGRGVTVHLSAVLDDGTWLVELRQPAGQRGRVTDAAPGETVALPGAASLTLEYRYSGQAATRMWAACATIDGDAEAFLRRHGQPIRYSYVPDPWPLADYQTVFARCPGSAEMPSAARPFTPELVTDLIAAGVIFAPVTLHAGVASLEAGEPPLPERFTVPEATAQLVNMTLAAGRRVVAVGTTSTRALESAADASGIVAPSRGWTDLVLGPERQARIVNGLISGWHEPGASHLALLESVAGARLVHSAYQAAEQAGYLWHEFGDSCLLLPPAAGRRAAAPRPPLASAAARQPHHRAQPTPGRPAPDRR